MRPQGFKGPQHQHLSRRLEMSEVRYTETHMNSESTWGAELVCVSGSYGKIPSHRLLVQKLRQCDGTAT